VKLRNKLFSGLLGVTVLLIAWLTANSPGRFGWCWFGYATFNAWPRLVSDFQVRSDGFTRKVNKTHELTFEQIEWLLGDKPEVLIIATGWNGMTTPDQRIRDHRGCEVRLLRTGEAIKRFNELKRAGKRVAIHYHATC
jgi:hypothetical protein